MTVLLEIKGLTKAFGGLMAVKDVDFKINRGEIFGLIGPNGAGKTTIFNLISGMLPSTRGMILYEEANITGQSMHQIARRGLVRTFQLPTLFNNFTVLKNMLMGMHLHAEISFWRSLLGTSYTKKRESEVLGRALEILQEVGLFARKDEVASNLAHGHRRILQVAIGLGCQPGLLLLDEPMTGMNMQEVQEMMGLIKKLRDNRGVTIALVEHNIRAVMDLCDRIAVLNFGQKIAEGAPGDISQNQAVIQAYLGGSL